MRIVIGGDIAPINSNEKPFVEGDAALLLGNIKEKISNVDLFVCNLEVPLTNTKTPILKSGSSIKANPDTIKGIKAMGINLLSLANNHVGDYGDNGIKETLAVLENYKINNIGAGLNSNDAKHPFIYKKNDIAVGVLSYADHEFGMAQEHKSGANPFHLIDAFKDIKDLKKSVDYIIVMLHDGKEYYPYPSPELQKIGRHLIDIGADIVVCQHSHLIGAVEPFKKGKIVYGQGNFMFDYRANYSPEWSNGFLISINVDKDKNEIELIPFKQNYPSVVGLDREEKDAFFKAMEKRTEQVNDASFIKDSWNEFILKQKPSYLSTVFGYNTFISKVLKKTGLYKILISKNTLLILLNFFRSRVHRESFVSILENLTKNKK